MNLREWLKTGFGYELWATEQWIAAYPKMPEPKPAEEVLRHMLWAFQIWLSRVDLDFASEGDLSQVDFAQLCRRWSEIVETQNLDEVIQYKNTKGQDYQRQLGAIALHVINHGTYHRGQLRGLAEEQGFEEFPETDLLGYFIEKRLFED